MDLNNYGTYLQGLHFAKQSCFNYPENILVFAVSLGRSYIMISQKSCAV